jgi:hypothetical protein
MTKHTPGPWYVNDNTEERGAEVQSESGMSVANCFPEDASLIASAPDLLAALEAALYSDYDDYSWEKAAKAAIAKAKGE